MKITFKKSWNPWRQMKDAEKLISIWQDYIHVMHRELARYEVALEEINSMRPKSRRNNTAHDMADVALEALTAEVKE